MGKKVYPRWNKAGVPELKTRELQDTDMYTIMKKERSMAELLYGGIHLGELRGKDAHRAIKQLYVREDTEQARRVLMWGR